MTNNRIDSLDYLRGLMALSVMLYHFSIWSMTTPDASSLLGKLGVYAVSMFYILSGLSLTIVYKHKFRKPRDLHNYVIKRLLRIFPLLWIAIAGTLALDALRTLVGVEVTWPTSTQLALNFSLLFGFIAHSEYIATGSWSIGNELVFYAFFPFLIMLGRKSNALLLVILVIAATLFAFMSFIAFTPEHSITDQWDEYINPINQIHLFVIGVALGLAFTPNIRHRNAATFGLVTMMAAFIAYPTSGDQMYLVTGWNRILLTIICAGVVFSLYIGDLKLPDLPGRTLRTLGDISYSVYLLHPIICLPLLFLSDKLGGDRTLILYAVGAPITLIVSYASYHNIERKMVALGSSLASSRYDTK